MRWEMLGEIRNTYTILVEKAERKRPLRRPRQRWEDTIKMDLKEIGLHTTGSYLEPVESSPHVYTLVSLGSDVLLTSHLCLQLPRGLSLSDFPTNLCSHFSTPHKC
jgi:hypothetical protein